MPILKTIFLGIFFTIFINGKGHININNLSKFSSFSIEKKQNPETKKAFSTNNEDENSLINRKRKSRGVEVAVPFISNLTFKQQFVYSDLQPLFFNYTYTSFLYCARGKRGPPQA